MKYFVLEPPLQNIEILFKILSLPNIAKVMTYYLVREGSVVLPQNLDI